MQNEENTILDYARQFVASTNLPVFLTGKAGTGKTTFLKNLQLASPKRMVVAAPTGIAAINAGGVTLHSLFQLPPGIFIPGTNSMQTLSSIRFTAEKRMLLQKMELLVIDEISMVRADLFDAIDHILQIIRSSTEPFGGVQLLLIGDLFQLAPVARNEDLEILQAYYRSNYFFDAAVMKRMALIGIELTQVFRQKDTGFIELLNTIRNGTCDDNDLSAINKNYQPSFKIGNDEFCPTLTTLNERADSINQENLAALPGEAVAYNAAINGDFPLKSSPAEEVLKLKVGAHIIFIKNDSGDNRRYFNGKAGIIDSVSEHSVSVRTKEGVVIELQQETWTNTRFQLSEQGQIQQEQLGTLRQFPLRLGWAITIHKSQGLTFEKAVIDAGESFAAGQAYVALSRLTDLEGLILSSPITKASVITDKSVLDFSKRLTPTHALQNLLLHGTKSHVIDLISGTMQFSGLGESVIKVTDKLTSQNNSAILPDLSECMAVSAKFIAQLEKLFGEQQPDVQLISERISKAAAFFTEKLDGHLQTIQTAIAGLKKGKGVKQLTRDLQELYALVQEKKEGLQDANDIYRFFSRGDLVADIRRIISQRETERAKQANERAQLLKDDSKGFINGTQDATLELFRRGLTMPEMAAKRHVSLGTIEQHLCLLLQTGKLQISELVPAEKVRKILSVLANDPAATTSQVRAQIGNSYSFSEIRFVAEFQKLPQVIANQQVVKNGNLFAL